MGRQWLTEAAGYAVFTPTDRSPTLRVAVYAAPKPVSAMHAGTTNFNIKKNSGRSSFVAACRHRSEHGPSWTTRSRDRKPGKPFELQFARTACLPIANILRYVGVTSDLGVNGTQPGAAVFTFGIEGFGDAAVPEFNSSDKEIFIDTNHDGTFDFAIFLELPRERDSAQQHIFAGCGGPSHKYGNAASVPI